MMVCPPSPASSSSSAGQALFLLKILDGRGITASTRLEAQGQDGLRGFLDIEHGDLGPGKVTRDRLVPRGTRRRRSRP